MCRRLIFPFKLLLFARDMGSSSFSSFCFLCFSATSTYRPSIKGIKEVVSCVVIVVFVDFVATDTYCFVFTQQQDKISCVEKNVNSIIESARWR